MRATRILGWAVLASTAVAQGDSSETTSRTDEGTGSVVTLTGSNTASVTLDGTNYVRVTTGVTYASGETITFTSTSSLFAQPTGLSSVLNNATASGNSTSASQTLLVGGTATTSLANATQTTNSTATSTAAQPSNTVPCNGYTEFCNRAYSNVTYVAAHNSPFIRPGNIASNQELEVTSQLNDGIRMLQFQVHDLNGTLQLCHTSCDMLNAGTLEDYLVTVYNWMQANPYDVITILMGNYDVLPPERFVEPVQNSGLLKYAYRPPQVPMALDDWPTLGEMILRQQRLVVMLDYEANQQEIPWLLDEFSQMWENPFSPTERDFPCDVQRPPDQDRNTSMNRMYMANQNLNLQVAIAGISLLIPASNFLNETNAPEGFGSAGRSVDTCIGDWDRPPNFILVDYYNVGSFNGSIFQVAASANNVNYDRDSCCDTSQRNFDSGVGTLVSQNGWLALVLAFGVLFCW
jgi:hypothetical protein